MQDTYMQDKIDTDPDFIALKRYGFSLEKLMLKYPDGVPNTERGMRLIAQALKMTPEEIQRVTDTIIKTLRKNLHIDPT